MNFILRSVGQKGHVNNKIIGSSYNPIFNCEPNKEGFKVLIKDYDEDTHEAIHGFIIYNDGRDWIPLYISNVYYIMTENGKTFDTIKYYGTHEPNCKSTKTPNTGPR